MSLSPSGDDMTEYPDFEVQTVFYETAFGSAQSNSPEANVTTVHEHDPVEIDGGIDNSEVAELVAMHGHAYAAPDTQGSQNQTEDGLIELRGVVGANMGSIDALPDDGERGGSVTELLRENLPDGEDLSNVQRPVQSEEDQSVFEHYHVSTPVGFRDTTNTLGGSAGVQYDRFGLNFRDLYGRGPIFDASDEVSVVQKLIKNNVVRGTDSGLHMRFVWDISEIEGTRRQFSLP